MNKKINDILLIHGAWHGGWCWEKIEKLVPSNEYKLHMPTLLGLSSKHDPLSKTVGLHGHIEQIEGYIIENNLDDVILLGHSYAGLVITGVANKVPKKISKLIYLDAFLPMHNQSLFDMSLESRVKAMKDSLTDDKGMTTADGAKEVWLLPIRDPRFFGVTDPEDIAHAQKMMVPMPVKTFEEKVEANNPLLKDIDKYYIRCTKNSLTEKFMDKTTELNIEYFEVDAGHDIMISEPEKLLNLLLEITKNQ